MINNHRGNLRAGTAETLTEDQVSHEQEMTNLMVTAMGDCDHECYWVEPFGWVPECGCPVHDVETH